jgi:hypothetical protein
MGSSYRNLLLDAEVHLLPKDEILIRVFTFRPETWFLSSFHHVCVAGQQV